MVSAKATTAKQPITLERMRKQVSRARKPHTGDQASHMVNRILTQRGDVLILRTEQSFTIYAVGRFANDGQQDFRGEMNVENIIYTAAVAEAKRLVVSGRRILFRNIDTGDWSEISD